MKPFYNCFIKTLFLKVHKIHRKAPPREDILREVGGLDLLRNWKLLFTAGVFR